MPAKTADFPRTLPKTWSALARLRELRPIADEDDLDFANALAGRLATLDENSTTADQDAYLESLATLIDVYEARHHPTADPSITPLHRLRFLMEEHGMSQRELGRLLGDSSGALGGRILRGERALSKAHILTLAKRFKLSPAAFLAAT
jgi:antitoxin component HigA of HigAB toxin-antitoxin module